VRELEVKIVLEDGERLEAVIENGKLKVGDFEIDTNVFKEVFIEEFKSRFGKEPIMIIEK